MTNSLANQTEARKLF